MSFIEAIWFCGGVVRRKLSTHVTSLCSPLLQVLPIMGNGEGEVILEIIPDFETTGAKLQRVSQEMNNNLQENTKLQGDLDGFKKEVDHLRGEVNRMSAENDRFSANNKKLEEENNRFADNNKKLEEENGKFAENNKKLEAQVSTMLVS